LKREPHALPYIDCEFLKREPYVPVSSYGIWHKYCVLKEIHIPLPNEFAALKENVRNP
jgi:hypothetical protein